MAPKHLIAMENVNDLDRDRVMASDNIISDLGPQFDCDGYRSWCKRRGILYRYSSTGSLAATAVVERFFRSLKVELTS